MPSYFVYIARCADRTLYTGYCSDIQKREAKHNSGQGARYTKQRRPVKIVYSEKHPTRAEAMRREIQIKRWKRVEKESLILRIQKKRRIKITNSI